MDNVRLIECPTEPEAQLVASLLRENGIESFLKRSDFSAGLLGAAGGGGPIEVWVAEGDLASAQTLLEPADE
jgi:Putative prokaryotic signal transducing protein